MSATGAVSGDHVWARSIGGNEDTSSDGKNGGTARTETESPIAMAMISHIETLPNRSNWIGLAREEDERV